MMPQPLEPGLRGAYLHLDGGCDAARKRQMIFKAGMIPTIRANPRHRTATQRGRKRCATQ
jgi:hypothetical protein